MIVATEKRQTDGTAIHKHRARIFPLSRVHPLSRVYKIVSFVLMGMATWQGGQCTLGHGSRKLNVVMAYQKEAYRLNILLRGLKYRSRIQPRDPLPYSHYGSAGIWVGEAFPYDKAIQVIKRSRRYYRQLRYIALSDIIPGAPDAIRYQLFIGGSTRQALKIGLQAWKAEDFKKLEGIRSKAEFHDLIRSFYGRQRNLKDP